MAHDRDVAYAVGYFGRSNLEAKICGDFYRSGLARHRAHPRVANLNLDLQKMAFYTENGRDEKNMDLRGVHLSSGNRRKSLINARGEEP